jgi:hypothetical protein
MVYVEGYKGYMIRVDRKGCWTCDYYDRELHFCHQLTKKTEGDYMCSFYAPRGQGGGE